MTKQDEAISPTTLATELDVTEAALARWRVVGIGPPFIKISHRCVRYSRHAVEEWKAASTRTSTTARDCVAVAA
jgi:hypothetical protein